MSPQFIYFFQTLLNGLAVGSMYSMIAVGYSMVYCLLNRVNFAHGDLYVFGTFVAFSLMTILPVPAAILLACMFAGLIGMTIERTVYRPVRDAFRLVPMISALGAALVLRTIAQIVWGTEAIAFPSLLPAGFFEIAGMKVFYKNFVIIGISLAIVVGLTLFMKYTKLGRATQCIVESISTASLMGIPINTIIPLIYALGGFFGVVGGVAYSSYYGVVSMDMGIWGTIKAWAAVILGGVGTTYGAFIGGLILGIAETFAAGYLSSAYKEAMGYIVIIVILMLKPTGLLGKKKVEKV